MKKILPYFKPYKVQSILGPLFKLLEASFELIVPVIVSLIVDKGLGAYVDGGYPNADRSYIVSMCLVLCAFGLVGLACSVTAQYFAAKAAAGVSAQVRKALFGKLQSLSYSDMDKLGTSAMLTRMTNDVNQLQAGINMVLRLFLRSPFIVFGAMIMAFFIDPTSALVFAGAIPVLAAVVFAIMLVCMPLYKKSQAKLDKVLLSTRENLTGARVLRAFCKEEDEKQLFSRRNGALTKSQKFVGGISALMNPLTYALINVAIVVLIYVGALRVNSGHISQGNVLALYNLMSQILVELIKLANLIITVTKSAACGSRIEGVLVMESSLQLFPSSDFESEKQAERSGALASDSADSVNSADSAAFIEFDHVSMRYQGGGENALTDIDFCLKRGETVGVIGGTGSGKTTLLRILAGLDRDFEGELSKTDFEDVAYMATEGGFPFGMSVRDAVNFYAAFLPRLDADAIFRDAREAGIRPRQSVIGMSSGMKQYLKFLLTAYSGARVCLFDEPLSNLDVNLRSKIVETLIMQCGGERLFIVTTHEIKEVETLIDGFFILKDGRLSPYYSSEKVRETTGNSVAEFYRRKVNE